MTPSARILMALALVVWLLGAGGTVAARPAESGVDRTVESTGSADNDGFDRQALQDRMVKRTGELARHLALPFLFVWLVGVGGLLVMVRGRRTRPNQDGDRLQPTAAFFLLALFGYLAAQAATTIGLLGLRSALPDTALPLASALGQAVALGATFWLALSVLRWRLPGLGLHRAGLGRGLALALVVYVVQIPVFVASLVASDWLGPRRFQMQVIEIARHTDLVFRGLFFVAVVVLAPLLEELIFRGLLLAGMRRRLGPVGAVVLSACLFALVHPPSTYLPIFWLGLVFGWIYLYTRNLFVPVALHALHNGLQYLLILWAMSGS